MYQLTRNRVYMLRVDLEDFTGRKGFALYSSFSVHSETDGYINCLFQGSMMEEQVGCFHSH